MLPEIIPGILAHSVEEYVAHLQLLEASSATWAHIDIMDGQFVPNISVMPHEIMSLSTRLKLEAHLMTMSPERYFSDLTVAGVYRVLIHREAYTSLAECAEAIDEAADYFPEVGLVINATTEVDVLSSLKINEVQCMGVVPGAAGQPFDAHAYDTIQKVAAQALPVVIAADGAVGDETIVRLRACGVSRFVISSRLFAGQAVSANIEHFINILKEEDGIN